MPEPEVDSAAPHNRPAKRRKRHIGMIILAALVVAIALLIIFWNWDWFIPFVDARASAAIGRRVTMSHLHVRLGRTTRIIADDVTIANPDKFPGKKPLAQVAHLTIDGDLLAYIRTRHVVLPTIALDHPDIVALSLADGRNNFTLALPKQAAASASPPPSIGTLIISDGIVRVIDPRFKSDFTLLVATRAASRREPEAIIVDAHGTYAGQSITGRFIGGALLTLRDAAHPYPIDLHLANGPTHVAMVGTVENPLKFTGAHIKLQFSGPDMSALYPLTGIPIPRTPPFSIAGDLDYARPKIRFTDFTGRVGSSDLNGDILEDPGIGGKPDVTMNLWSKHVDLTDLGGFIGTPPGKQTTPGQTAQQKAALAHAEAKKTLLPSTPINLPKLRAATIHLKYKGEHIENRYTPFDNIVVALDIVDGRITLHPLDFAVGTGRIASDIDLAPDPRGVLSARADIRFQHIDLSRVLEATHTFHGKGIIGGEARIDSRGNSLAALMGDGNGELKLVLLGGGNLSALLVDISGLQFGNALLSALGLPNRTDIECFVTDMPLQHGVLSTEVLLLDTKEGRVTGKGTVNFANQTLDYTLTTRSKHFSIGSLPGPVHIDGPLGSPGIRPGTETIVRAGAAAGLGVLLTPLGALLPTIQFGVGNDNACTAAVAQEREPLRVSMPPHQRKTRRRLTNHDAASR
ncbi:MAG TPA: AsmA family protein [Acetobacteraceae bacterium]|nr:AsmA family protein [Acetobacteraceae bacterium]